MPVLAGSFRRRKPHGGTCANKAGRGAIAPRPLRKGANSALGVDRTKTDTGGLVENTKVRGRRTGKELGKFTL